MLELRKVYVVERRDQVDIIAGILEAAKVGETKTQIMHSANLNHQQIKKYLTLLVKKGLLKKAKQRKKRLFKISDKGLKYLREYRELKAFLRL